MDPSLGDLTIMLTRPTEQAASLQKKLTRLGAHTISFPCIEISPVTPSKSPAPLSEIDIIIFISPNAVKYGLREMPELLDLPRSGKKFAAIGQGTAQALTANGIAEVTIPDERFDSEGLLETALFQDLKSMSVMVIKGEGGRNYLQESLTQRGARVCCVDVYQRTLPENADIEALPATVDLILFSSSQAAENLLSLVPAQQLQKLLKCQTIVGHPKIGQKVASLGFKKLPIIAGSPMEDDFLQAIRGWASRR